METMNRQNVVLGGLDLNLEKAEDTKAVTPVSKNEVTEFTNTYKAKLRNDPTVQSLTSKIVVTSPTSILSFGEEATKEINSISDSILNSIKSVDQEEAGAILVQLTKIMDKFNIEELKDINNIKEPSLFQKMFKKVKNSVEEMLKKYDSLGADVEKIYISLKKYEQDIQTQTEMLSNLYKENINFYESLEKYIVAGELVSEELRDCYIPQFEQKAMESGESIDQNNLQVITTCKTMVDERVHDLKLAEQVALQSLPMIQQMQYGNFQLLKTIKSSFIITLPIFKQALVQAVIAKRQQVMMNSLQKVKDTTNELIEKNARNVADTAIAMTKMSGEGAVSLNSLQKSFDIIMKGIEETKKQEAENEKRRALESKELDKLKYQALTQKKCSDVPQLNNDNTHQSNIGTKLSF